jgi:hypothetical protein
MCGVPDQAAAAIYRTRPAAVIAKPKSVRRMNVLLEIFDAGIIDRETLDQALQDEIYRGSMLGSESSVLVQLTGRRQGHCVEFRMQDGEGEIEGTWYTIEDT